MVQQIVQHSLLREIKDNLLLSSPLMAAWLIYSLGPFAGTAMVAQLGPNVLAASVLVGTIWIAGITFCFGLFHSVSVLISQQLGAKNYEAISEVMGQTFLLNVLSWIPLMLLMWIVPFLVQWSSPNPEILHFATQYAHALLLAVPGLISLAILEHFLSGIGKTQMSLWLSFIEIPIEIAFIYIFVFGKFGMPACGLAGVGYGLALSYTLTSILVYIYLHYANFAKPFRIYEKVGTFNWLYCKEMLKIGLPIGFTYFIELVAFTIATYFISRFSTTALAAHQIIMQFEAVIINIPYAIAQGVSIRVGLNVGRNDKKGVIYSSYVGIGLGLVASLFIFLILIMFPHFLLAIDLNETELKNQELTGLAISLFFIVGLYQIFDSLRVLEAGALRGLKDTRYTLWVNIICFLLIGLLAAYLLGIVFHQNVQGVWYGLVIGMALGSTALFIRLKKILMNANLSDILKI